MCYRFPMRKEVIQKNPNKKILWVIQRVLTVLSNMTRCLICLNVNSVRSVWEKKACHCQTLHSDRAFFNSFVLFIYQTSLVLLSYHKTWYFFLTNFISDSNNNQSGRRRRESGNRECLPGWQAHQEQTNTAWFQRTLKSLLINSVSHNLPLPLVLQTATCIGVLN